MRGKLEDQGGLFTYVSLEARVPKDHPLRKIGELVQEVFRPFKGQFASLCASLLKG